MNDRLLFMTSRDSATTYSTHYAITPEFVDKYMSFGKNSVVFINACNAGSTTGTTASAMIFAFHKRAPGFTSVLMDSSQTARSISSSTSSTGCWALKRPGRIAGSASLRG